MEKFIKLGCTMKHRDMNDWTLEIIFGWGMLGVHYLNWLVIWSYRKLSVEVLSCPGGLPWAWAQGGWSMVHRKYLGQKHGSHSNAINTKLSVKFHDILIASPLSPNYIPFLNKIIKQNIWLKLANQIALYHIMSPSYTQYFTSIYTYC
jgi:hypothetical protein